MLVNRDFSGGIAAMLETFRKHETSGMALEAASVCVIGQILRSWANVAVALEDACAERDQLRAIAADLAVMAEAPPALNAMRDATRRAVELPGTNIVVQPSLFDRRVDRQTGQDGGAA